MPSGAVGSCSAQPGPGPQPTWSTALPSMIRRSTVPWPFAMGYRPWYGVPGLCRADPVAAGLSGPGPHAEPRGPDAGPAARPSLYPGARAVLCGPASISCAGMRQPVRDQADAADHRGHRAGISTLGGRGTDHAWLGPGHAGHRRRAWYRYARVSPPIGPPGSTVSGRISDHAGGGTGHLGQPEAGLTALAEALTLVEQTGERY